MRTSTKALKEATKRKPREPKQDFVDYSKLPKFNDEQWFNIQVWGSKTAPKVK